MASKDCRFTLGFTYYNEPELLRQQLNLWKHYPHQVEIILVDDGSEEFPAYDIVKDFDYPTFQLWRVDEDLGFNSHGCRNLIAELATCDNILFSDIDCHFSPETIAFLKRVNFNPERLYYFSFYSSASFQYHPWPGHPNVFAINKDKFWEAGGYDESFTGWHHGDREFIERLQIVTELSKISDHLGFTVVRGARKCEVDARVDKTTYDDVNMVIKIPTCMPPESELKGTVKEKINFSYSRLL
jgi:hypothetical protein